MGGKRGGENTKRAAGNAKKAEVAAQKQEAKDADEASKKAGKWSEGARTNAKREAEAEKKAEAARKKAERDALLAEEESQQRSIPKNAKSKTAAKKSQKGTTSLDLSSLGPAIDEAGAAEAAPTLNASGIDNALDAWSLATDANDQKIDRRPERRYRAAYKAYEDRRLPQIAEECPGLRRQQRVEMCRKEFDRSDANPFNQAGNVDWNATKEEVTEARERIRSEVEERLAEKPV